VRGAFALGMSAVWKTMIGISSAGLLTTLLLKEIPMHETSDQNYALDDGHARQPTDRTASHESEKVRVPDTLVDSNS
jgi:hypothetical protein